MEDLRAVILHPDTEGIQEVRALYEESFPEAERIPWAYLIQEDPSRIMRAYYADQKLIGLAYTFACADLVYLGYLAIARAEQNRSYGTAILKQLLAEYKDRMIVLDIEEVGKETSGIRKQRRDFYLRRGFHPARLHYRIFGVDYEILSTRGTITKEAWTAFAEAHATKEIADRIEYYEPD